MNGERGAVISGIGQSDVGRRLYRRPLDLTVDAALAAMEDAGLTRDDIDGLAALSGLEHVQLLSRLIDLELQGRVRRVGSGRFMRSGRTC